MKGIHPYVRARFIQQQRIKERARVLEHYGFTWEEAKAVSRYLDDVAWKEKCLGSFKTG